MISGLRNSTAKDAHPLLNRDGNRDFWARMFNRIEEMFADLKRSIRTSFSVTMGAEDLRIHNLCWGEKAGARRQLLAHALVISFETINLDHIDNRDAYAFGFMTPVLRRVTL
jgi:hypothetical protein